MKPCPFCGSEVVRDFVNNDQFKDISCNKCGESFRMTDEQWNTRACAWQPIETAPLDRPIIIVFEDEHMVIYRFDVNHDTPQELVKRGIVGCKATHWQPLPEPPKETK